jgi:tellurite resistance protein
MFLNLFSPKEKAGFLALSKQMILSDELIAESEVVKYKASKYEMEILEEMTQEELKNEIEQLPKDFLEITKIFTTQRSKIAVLVELVALAFADGKFVAQEKNLIFQIAENFGFSRQETQGYIEWALKVYEEN